MWCIELRQFVRKDLFSSIRLGLSVELNVVVSAELIGPCREIYLYLSDKDLAPKQVFFSEILTDYIFVWKFCILWLYQRTELLCQKNVVNLLSQTVVSTTRTHCIDPFLFFTLALEALVMHGSESKTGRQVHH